MQLGRCILSALALWGDFKQSGGGKPKLSTIAELLVAGPVQDIRSEGSDFENLSKIPG